MIEKSTQTAKKPVNEQPESHQEALRATESVKPISNALYYSTLKWNNKITVYRCLYKNCDHQLENEDDIILHTIRHYPKETQDTLLNQLLENKKKGSK